MRHRSGNFQVERQKMMKPTVGTAVLLSFLLLVLSCPALAQDEQLLGDLSAKKEQKIPAMPGPREKAAKLLVDASNVDAFKELLLEPLVLLVNNQQLVLRVFNALDYEWQLSKEWQEKTATNPAHYMLDEGHNLKLQGDAAPAIGFPFGQAENINLETNPETKAYKILWNCVSAEGAAGDILYDSSLDWFLHQSLLRESKGFLYRRWHFEPNTAAGSEKQAADAQEAKLRPAAAAAQPEVSPVTPGLSGPHDIFRQDLLQFVSPAVVFGYAQISWRFRGDEEDRGWIFSPVIGKGRAVLSSNRSDPLLEGSMTLDDFLVWSTKLQTVTARVAAEKTLLAPFPAVTYYSADYEPVGAGIVTAGEPAEQPAGLPAAAKDSEKSLTVHGYHQRPDGSYSTVIWNYEGKRFENGAPWLPVTAVFVPRKTWILELQPKDPYYTTGRELLVVDQQTMLPLYKVVYDYYGNYQRLVMGAWSLAVAKDEKSRFPFAAFVLAVEPGGARATSFASSQVRTFSGGDSKTAGYLRALFDIKRHASRPQPAAADREGTKDIETPEELNQPADSSKPGHKAPGGEESINQED